jgi:gentisate 1,2-dioxygenase
MADMPVQLPADPQTPAGARARYFNSGNAFNIKLTSVPGRIFSDEPLQAQSGATGFYACDQAAALECDFQATTPLMLARYGRILAGEILQADFKATGCIWYVIAGSGMASLGAEVIHWQAGDIFLSSGAGTVQLLAASDALLWLVSNEPQLAFDGLVPDPAIPVELVHYPAQEIAAQIEGLYRTAADETVSGLAVIFSTDRLQACRNLLPSLTLSLNTLPAHTHQRAHRHNSAAITLVVQGQGSYSMVDNVRCDWSPWATLITPPGAPHSHHNGGEERALFLIVQDGGLHYHARTMGFEFLAGD